MTIRRNGTDSGAVAARRIEEEILQAIRAMRYGTITITVHDFHVVQIERAEKIRIERDGTRNAS